MVVTFSGDIDPKDHRASDMLTAKKYMNPNMLAFIELRPPLFRYYRHLDLVIRDGQYASQVADRALFFLCGGSAFGRGAEE